MSNPTMKAVIFDGPHKVSVQERPIPVIQDETDIIVKVTYTALCGSELHVYRGHQPSPINFIMGHEFTGLVTATGSAITTVSIGDKVVSPFTTSCGSCFYCRNAFSSRCTSSLLFGTAALNGAQAAYVRIPFADSTVLKAPPSIPDKALVLMADIFPTGYFGAASAFKMLSPAQIAAATVVVIGCGPVGLCAIVAARSFGPKTVFAVDSVESRLELAGMLGAQPLDFARDKQGMGEAIKEATGGRGADVVIEVVGLSPALRTAFDLLRPFGILSSLGVHNGEVPWTAKEAYNKNLRLLMGRCPVRSIFSEALELFQENQDKLRFMFDTIMPIDGAVEGYDIFDKMKAQKIIFQP